MSCVLRSVKSWVVGDESARILAKALHENRLKIMKDQFDLHLRNSNYVKVARKLLHVQELRLAEEWAET